MRAAFFVVRRCSLFEHSGWQGSQGFVRTERSRGRRRGGKVFELLRMFGGVDAWDWLWVVQVVVLERGNGQGLVHCRHQLDIPAAAEAADEVHVSLIKVGGDFYLMDARLQGVFLTMKLGEY